jgi:hypothetical protein
MALFIKCVIYRLCLNFEILKNIKNGFVHKVCYLQTVSKH